MKNLKFLERKLKENNIEYDNIEYIENKSPTYWVDLKIIFKDIEEFEIIRLPAYSKKEYKLNNYNKMITEKVQEIKEALQEYERIFSK